MRNARREAGGKVPLAATITAIALAVVSCSSDDTQSLETVTTDSGLTITITQGGAGSVAEVGDFVTVHYTGWLYEPGADGGRGAKFDSSLDRGTPFPFPLGAGRVIAGWDEGVAGMLVGETRELIIPPDLAYGSRGAGDLIPPDSTLLFEVELLGVE